MSGGNGSGVSFGLVALVGLLILVGYNLYTGVELKRIGIPGVFEVEFGERRRDAPRGPTWESPREPPWESWEQHPGGGHPGPDIAELEERLHENARAQEEARWGIERGRRLLGEDPDAPHVVADQEAWLRQLERERQELEAALRGAQP